MAFPDAEISVVTEDKLCDHLLNPSHAVGGPKAAWSASIGYTRGNWSELRDDLLSMAMTCEDFVAKPSPYGVKYETTGVLGTKGIVLAMSLPFGLLKRTHHLDWLLRTQEMADDRRTFDGCSK